MRPCLITWAMSESSSTTSKFAMRLWSLSSCFLQDNDNLTTTASDGNSCASYHQRIRIIRVSAVDKASYCLTSVYILVHIIIWDLESTIHLCRSSSVTWFCIYALFGWAFSSLIYLFHGWILAARTIWVCMYVYVYVWCLTISAKVLSPSFI